MLDFRQYNSDMTPDENAVVSNDNFNRLQIYTDNLVPPATVTLTAAANAPVGWLLCDGTAISRSRYKNLFAAIGTTYGTGDGSTTFNLPNLKGRVPVGKDAGQTEFNTMGKTGGDKNLQSHNHTIPDHQHAIRAEYGTGSYLSSGPPGQYNQLTNNAGYAFQYSYTRGDGGGGGTSYAGSGGSQNLQPYLTMNYIIKT